MRVQFRVSGRKPEEQRAEPPSQNARQTAGAAALHFSFGAPRSGSTGPRRLFVPQNSFLSPAFVAAAERPHAILRMQSSSG